MKLILDLENLHQNWKMLFFDSPQSKGFTRYQKILWGCSFGCKNLLNFTCLIMKFHNCHHANLELISILLLQCHVMVSYIDKLWEYITPQMSTFNAVHMAHLSNCNAMYFHQIIYSFALKCICNFDEFYLKRLFRCELRITKVIG